MTPPLNLAVLSRLLTQPWAMREASLVALTQTVLSGAVQIRPRAELHQQRLAPQADTSWSVPQWDNENDRVVRRPYPTKAGYTVLNYEALMADLRGTLPDVPAGVHVVMVWGALGRGWTDVDRWYLDPVELDELTAAVAAQPEGSTVVLWFRSPGGIITGTPEAAAELRRLGRTHRLLAFTDDLCASAAYWLGAQCERIVATPTAEVGSIGVYIAFYDFVAYLEKMGVKLELFRAGDLKGLGVMGNPLDEKARAYLQASVVDSMKLFTRDVTAMRAINEADMQGQTQRGKLALAANLADSLIPSASAFFTALGAGKV